MYLGLVVGTSDVKAVCPNEACGIVVSAGREFAPLHAAAPLWFERHLDAWANTTIDAVASWKPSRLASVPLTKAGARYCMVGEIAAPTGHMAMAVEQIVVARSPSWEEIS